MISLITFSMILAHIYAQACLENQTQYNYKCIDNTCFDNYNKRFKGDVDSNGVAHLNMNFTGQVEFLGGNLQVSISFSDIPNDRTMKRDNAASCLEDQLVNYQKEDFTGRSIISNTIVSSFDSSTKYTTWKYNLTMSELESYAIKDKSKQGLIDYYGYQGIEFNIAGQKQVTYNYNIKVSLNTSINTQISTSFTGLVQKDTASCNPSGQCIAKADSEVAFYTDITCTTKKTVTSLYLNQRIFMKQWITTSGFETFQLTLQSVYYKGDGLNRQTTPIQKVSNPGSLCMELSVEFVYSSVKIVLDTVLGDGSNAPAPGTDTTNANSNTNTNTTNNSNTGTTNTTTTTTPTTTDTTLTTTNTTTPNTTSTVPNTNDATNTNTTTTTTTTTTNNTTTNNTTTNNTTTNTTTNSTTNTTTDTTSPDTVVKVYSTSSVEAAHAMAEVTIDCVKLNETSTTCPTCEEIVALGMVDSSCPSPSQTLSSNMLFISCIVVLLLF